MRRFLVVILSLLSLSFYGQTKADKVIWSYLIGNWECTKVLAAHKGDTTDVSKKEMPITNQYKANQDFTEKRDTGTTTKGKYSIDKTKNTIK